MTHASKTGTAIHAELERQLKLPDPPPAPQPVQVRRGRPFAGEAFRKQYTMRMSEEEHGILANASALEGLALGTWLRELGLARARKISK